MVEREQEIYTVLCCDQAKVYAESVIMGTAKTIETAISGYKLTDWVITFKK
jgi:hypothetical protein